MDFESLIREFKFLLDAGWTRIKWEINDNPLVLLVILVVLLVAWKIFGPEVKGR